MGDSPSLFGETIADQFQRFHEQHPSVYKQLVRLAYQWKDSGNEQLGIATLFERLRWEWHTGTVRDSSTGYKLNNNYRAYYARLIMDNNPELRGMFNLRAQKDDL